MRRTAASVEEGIARLFKKGDGLAPFDAWKALKKIVQGVSGAQVIDQVPHWNTGTGEHGLTAQDLGSIVTSLVLTAKNLTS